MSCSHFLEGVELSILHCLGYLGEAFQRCNHFLWILAFWFWCIAETLCGKLFLRSLGSDVLVLG